MVLKIAWDIGIFTLKGVYNGLYYLYYGNTDSNVDTLTENELQCKIKELEEKLKVLEEKSQTEL